MRKGQSDKRLEQFGRQIAAMRSSLPMTQADLARKVGVTPGLISQHEMGLIVDPRPETIYEFAKIFTNDSQPNNRESLYFSLVLDLVRERYRPKGGWLGMGDDDDEDLWGALKAVMSSSTHVPFKHLLRSRRSLLQVGEVLDVEAMAYWQRHMTDLRDLWVIAPNPLDGAVAIISSAVAHNITRSPQPVKYVYFLYEKDAKARLESIRREVKESLQAEGKEINEDDLKERINGYKITSPKPSESLSTLATFYMIANPGDPDMIGFRCILNDKRAEWAIRMGAKETTDILQDWQGLGSRNLIE